MPSPTLIRPPPVDTSKSPVENMMELTRLYIIEPDLFTNTRPLWHPPNARGIYGGAVIAQCLSAAFLTLPSPSSANSNVEYLPHSMHCYFVLAGDSEIPVIYSVERIRDGRSFLTRTVQAKQKGKCIFTTTISFMADGSGGKQALTHGWDMHPGAVQALEETLTKDQSHHDMTMPAPDSDDPDSQGVPFESKRLNIVNSRSGVFKVLVLTSQFLEDNSLLPHQRRFQSWLKCRGELKGGLSAHLCAMAYLSDRWFIGTSVRVHRGRAHWLAPQTYRNHILSLANLVEADYTNPEINAGARENILPAAGNSVNTSSEQPDNKVGMTVSLDHTIYFHSPRDVKMDDWTFSEMESPWASGGKGMVMQRIWNKQGKLLATCVQEGLIRLKQSEESISAKSKL